MFVTGAAAFLLPHIDMLMRFDERADTIFISARQSIYAAAGAFI